jgi:Ca-activated chloride channel family protein
MIRMKMMMALGLTLAVLATVNGLTVKVPFLIELPKAPVTTAIVQTPIQVPPPARPDGVVRWTVRPDHKVAMPGTDVYVLVTLEAEKLERAKRDPINLALVLDRSGSMSARRKLEYAKAAAHIVIDQLADTDRVTLIGFDSVSTVLVPSAPVRDRAALHAAIEALTPGGSTNVSAGLLDGIAEVQRHFVREHVNRVMLMTDGLSNFGETAPEAFARIATQAARAGISISTMGLGAEFSEDVMVAIAEHSGGRYYYIEDPAQMASIYRGEVQGMQHVVARDLKISLEARGGAVVEQVLGYRGSAVAPGGALALGDLYSGQTRKLVVRLRSPRTPAPEASLLNVRLTYQDARNHQVVSATKPASVRVAGDAVAAETSADREVLEKVESVRAAARLEEAMIHLDRGDRANAVRLLSEQVRRTRMLNERTVRSAQLNVQVEQMEQAMRQMDAFPAQSDAYRSYVKHQKATAYDLSR